jgi:hypothetical protein
MELGGHPARGAHRAVARGGCTTRLRVRRAALPHPAARQRQPYPRARGARRGLDHPFRAVGGPVGDYAQVLAAACTRQTSSGTRRRRPAGVGARGTDPRPAPTDPLQRAVGPPCRHRGGLPRPARPPERSVHRCGTQPGTRVSPRPVAPGAHRARPPRRRPGLRHRQGRRAARDATRGRAQVWAPEFVADDLHAARAAEGTPRPSSGGRAGPTPGRQRARPGRTRRGAAEQLAAVSAGRVDALERISPSAPTGSNATASCGRAAFAGDELERRGLDRDTMPRRRAAGAVHHRRRVQRRVRRRRREDRRGGAQPRSRSTS